MDTNQLPEGPWARMDAEQFMTGILAALKLRGRTKISIRTDRIDAAFEATYKRLVEMASEKGVDVRFQIILDPIHKDSGTVRHAIAMAAKRNIISLDNPEYQDMQLKLSDLEARMKLDRLPLGREGFSQLADVFLKQYSAPA